jgi:hypothetical protein
MHYRAELALRRLMPEWLKIRLRAARLLFTAPPPGASPIPQECLDGAMLLADRYEMLRRLPAGGVICELGTETGNFAAAMLETCRPLTLDIVDVDFSRCRADVQTDPRVRTHRMLTTEYLGSQPENRFDWIYVDADHTYEAVRADIALAKTRVRLGGLLVFNDFARFAHAGLGVIGVHQAVCEFIATEKWPVVYLALEGAALYDIAVRRPE